jgi:hypothetical protein
MEFYEGFPIKTNKTVLGFGGFSLGKAKNEAHFWRARTMLDVGTGFSIKLYPSIHASFVRGATRPQREL